MEDEDAGAQDVARLQAELDATRGRIASMERDAAAEQERLRAELAAATDAVAAFEADAAAMRTEVEASDGRLREAASRYRELAIRAEPSLPPELIAGDSIDAVEASLETARAIAGRVRSQMEQETQAARVPAGAPARGGADLSALSPEQKIRFGLGQRGG